MTKHPFASISSAPRPATRPTSRIVPPSTATSPSTGSPPVPSKIVPLRMTRSNAAAMLLLDDHLADRALLAPVRAPIVPEVRGAVLEHRGLEPQALQMAHEPCFSIVYIRRTRVEHMVIIYELHVARREVHEDREPWILGHLVDELHRLLRPRRDAWCVVVTLRREDVGTDVPDEQPIPPAGEHRGHVPRCFASRLLPA